MKEYLITVWDDGSKYSYRMGTNNIKDYEKQLKKDHDRFVVQPVPSFWEAANG